MAVKKQKVKFEVYKAVDSKNTPINIAGLLQRSNSLNNDQKEVSQYGMKTRIDKFENLTLDDQTLKKYPKLKLVYFHMTKMRDDGLATTREEINDLKNLDLDADEYVAEDINCIFDTQNCLLFIQRNFHSLSVTGVNYYLVKMHKRIAIKINKICDKQTYKPLDLQFEPVPDKEILNGIINSDNYRKIDLSFATSSIELFKGQEILNKCLGGMGTVLDNLGGYNVGITLTAGNAKNPSLNRSNLRKLANAVENDKTLFSSAIFSGKKGKTPVEKYDLINGKLCVSHKFSSVKKKGKKKKRMHLDSRSVRDVMQQLYLNGGIDSKEPLMEIALKNLK